MADSEHTLHLIAKLDTSEVQQQIDKLNAGKLQSTSGTAPAKGIVGNSAIGYVAAVAIASQLNKMKSQFQSVTSSMSGFQKSMSRISSSLTKLNDQIAGLVKRQKFLLKERYIGDSDAELQIRASLLGGRYIPMPPYDNLRKIPKEGILRSPSSGSTSARASDSATRSSDGVHMPNFLTPDHGTPQAGASAGAMPLYKNQLIRWGGAALGSQVLRGVGEYLEASRSPYADVVTTGGTMLQGAAIGAGAGATLGPQGAVIGAVLGTAIAATNKLFDIWTQRAREAQEEISNALKVDPNRRASISAAADMLRGLSQERELKMVSGMGTSSLDAVIERAAGKIKDIESKVDSTEYDSAQELQTLLSQRQWQQQLKQAAEERRQQIENAREESIQKNIEEQERREDILEAFKQTASDKSKQLAWGQIARYNVQKLQAMQADQDVDKEWLNAGYKAHGAESQRARRQMLEALKSTQSAKTSDEAQSFLDRAEEARQRWTFSLGQQDFFKSGLVQTLQQQLASIKPTDLSPVTSIGQYGYGMGEVNDNIDRQMQIWEEQASLQRQIKDILQDKTFEAYYAN